MKSDLIKSIELVEDAIDPRIHPTDRHQITLAIEKLKSLIADGERIDWLEKQKRANCPWENQVSIVFNWDEGSSIRQAIDERRKA